MNSKIFIFFILISMPLKLLGQPVTDIAKCPIDLKSSLTLKLVSSELDFYMLVDEGNFQLNKSSFYYPFIGLSLIVDYAYKSSHEIKTEPVLNHYFLFKPLSSHIQLSIYRSTGTKLLMRSIKCQRFNKK